MNTSSTEIPLPPYQVVSETFSLEALSVAIQDELVPYLIIANIIFT